MSVTTQGNTSMPQSVPAVPDALIGLITSEVMRQLNARGGQQQARPAPPVLTQQQPALQTQSIFDDIGNFFTHGPGSQIVSQVGNTIETQLPNLLGGLLSSLSNDPQFQQT